MALLHPPIISTDRFTYTERDRTFAAEDSDFGRNGLPLGQVYDDATDIGFTLRSTRTGKEIVFALWNTQRDREGDVQFDEYHPAPYQRGTKGLDDLKVIVFND